MTSTDHQAAAHLAAIVESSEDAMISKDLNGIIRTWNQAAERVYGYAAAEAISQPMTMLLPPERQTEEADILARLRRGEKVSHFDTTRVRKDGTIIQVSLTISPVYAADGTMLGASHVARDITERRKFEEQLRQSQRLESLGVLAGGIAHDFNNLLTGILGNASLVLDHRSQLDPDRPMLEDIVSSGKRAADLTNQLLAYAGKARFIITRFNLAELISELLHLIETSIPKLVQLQVEWEPDLPLIEADVSQIQKIVMNLVINAAEAIGPEGGTIWVSTGVADTEAA